MELVILDLEKDMVEAPWNPRRALEPGEAAFDNLSASLEHFRQVLPLVVSARSGMLIAGHQRRRVLLSKGITKAVALRVDAETEQDEKLMNVALNRLREGDWDMQNVKDLAKKIKDNELRRVAGLEPHVIADPWSDASAVGERVGKSQVTRVSTIGWEGYLYQRADAAEIGAALDLAVAAAVGVTGEDPEELVERLIIETFREEDQ